MKFAVAALLALPAVAAFQAPRPAFACTSQLSATVVTGPEGIAASSFEEDLALTLQLILDHDKRSATVSKAQFMSQMQEVAKIEKDPEKIAPVDVSIPYDAAAKLAYEASDKKMAYPDFKIKYETDAVALVKSKQAVDISIPYDAAAKNAYDASDKKMAYAAFKTQYEADAVAMVKSKQPVDVSIPYDAAAKLAYEASDKKMAYPDFKIKYEADAVALVTSKQAVDIFIPYDAAAKNAYDASDKKMAFAAFKTQYEADAVAMVKSKQQPATQAAPKAAAAPAAGVVDISIPYDAAAKLAYEASDKTVVYPDFKIKYEADAVADVIAKK
jgi:hypothetical protein